MKKLVFAILVLGLSLVSFTDNLARQPKNRNFDRPNRIVKELNLTELQKEKFTEIHLAQEEIKIDIDAKLKKNRLELKKLLLKGEINEQKIMELTDIGSNLKADLRKSRTKMWFDVYKILNENQKIKWTKHFTRMIQKGERFNDKHERKSCRIGRKNRFDDATSKFKKGNRSFDRNNVIPQSEE